MTNTIAINQQPLAGENSTAADHGVQAQIAPPGDRHILPNLFWAAVIFVALNILLLMWFTISPKLSRIVAGPIQKIETIAVADKPSPFTPVVDERRQARRMPEKVKPIVAASTIESLDAGPTSWQTVAVESQATEASYVRGNDVYNLMERQAEMPRITAANYPRSTEPRQRQPISPEVIR